MNDVINFFRARRTVFEMLEDRGYDVLGVEPEKDQVFNDFKKNYLHKNIDIFIDNPDRQVHIIFICQNKISPSILREHVEHSLTNFLTKDNKCLIFVMKKAPNNSSLKIKNKHKFIQLFCVKQLIVNITHHTLVPKHIMLSEEDKATILTEYHVPDITHFPIILKKDPICQYYNMKRNDMCRIIRKSPSAGMVEYYRVVY